VGLHLDNTRSFKYTPKHTLAKKHTSANKYTFLKKKHVGKK
jgi:hypothetical protein